MDWAAETGPDPSMVAADWLARDLMPGSRSAVDLLTASATPLAVLREAKEVYKAMRVMGDLPADRRTGARLYLAAIAAALAFHGARISSQADPALKEALEEMRRDLEAPEALRSLAAAALRRLRSASRRGKRPSR